MADTTYNGWTNYETWLVNLHIDNTQSSQEEWRAEAEAALEVAREDLEAVSDVPFDDTKVREEAIHVLRRLMQEEFCGEQAPELPGFYGDLLRAALSEVNWYEIARHYIDYAVEEESNA